VASIVEKHHFVYQERQKHKHLTSLFSVCTHSCYFFSGSFAWSSNQPGWTPTDFFNTLQGNSSHSVQNRSFLSVLQHLNILQSGLSSLPQPLHSPVM